jgi:hypothetical protein
MRSAHQPLGQSVTAQARSRPPGVIAAAAITAKYRAKRMQRSGRSICTGAWYQARKRDTLSHEHFVTDLANHSAME